MRSIRLFIALDLPPLDLFTDLQKKIDDPDLRKVTTFHLTLKFLGDVEEKCLGNLVERLLTICAQPISLCFDHIGFFPNSLHPQVVWVGIKEPDRVILVQKQIDTATSEWFAPEKHFHPHVTLARVKRLSKPNTWVKKTCELQVPSTNTVSSSFSLIQSTLTPQGPTYTVLKKFPLKT